MSDKMRDLTPVSVDFSGGEQLTSAKLTGWAAQIENGFRKLELVLGDPASHGYTIFESSTDTLTGGWCYGRTGVNLGAESRHLQIMSERKIHYSPRYTP